jgi:DNA-binding Lrp family transcriptional regulator
MASTVTGWWEVDGQSDEHLRARADAGGTAVRRPGSGVKVYVLVRTSLGRAQEVAGQLRRVPGVVTADPVTGEYQVIATCEFDDLGAIDTLLARAVRAAAGVLATSTAVAIR